jgi:hypothetical protein
MMIASYRFAIAGSPDYGLAAARSALHNTAPNAPDDNPNGERTESGTSQTVIHHNRSRL